MLVRGAAMTVLFGLVPSAGLVPSILAQERDARALPQAAGSQSLPSLGTASPVATTPDMPCAERGVVPRVRVLLVDPALGAAVVSDEEGRLRLVQRGDPLETSSETVCVVERFYTGALECAEEGSRERRRLRVAEVAQGESSPIEVLAHCAPESIERPSTTSTRQDLPPP